MKQITIIGGGPAALMFAAKIDTKKYQVTLCERKKAVGRKFLVAGEGGLNLTYNASIEEFIAQYAPSGFLDAAIRQFTNEDLMNWFNNLDIPTFIGSSNRVFPDLALKPIEVLGKIVKHIEAKGVKCQFDRRWTGWNKEGHLCFEEGEDIKPEIVVFALGGGSWKVTGSDGAWLNTFEARGVAVVPFTPVNCAFGVDWHQNVIMTHEGKPLKNIALTYNDRMSKGELVISKFGLEGNAIYAISQKLQEDLHTKESVVVYLDLKPTMTLDQVKDKYKASKLSRVTDILREDLNLDRTAIALLKQFSDKKTFENPNKLAKTIKAVPVTITSADELDKAISTVGGVDLDEVDDQFQCKKIPNSYVIGEMLDWYAPTGGYLLQGSFSMGVALAKHLNTLESAK